MPQEGNRHIGAGRYCPPPGAQTADIGFLHFRLHSESAGRRLPTVRTHTAVQCSRTDRSVGRRLTCTGRALCRTSVCRRSRRAADCKSPRRPSRTTSARGGHSAGRRVRIAGTSVSISAVHARSRRAANSRSDPAQGFSAAPIFACTPTLLPAYSANRSNANASPTDNALRAQQEHYLRRSSPPTRRASTSDA